MFHTVCMHRFACKCDCFFSFLFSAQSEVLSPGQSLDLPTISSRGVTDMEPATHLGVAQHDHPHQHHIDVNSQRLVVVNLIHLKKTNKQQNK